jgi:hypothetical protein
MKKYCLVILILFIFSCASKKHDAISSDTIEKSNSIEDTLLMRNGLLEKLNGQWINTTLFDSTLIRRELAPWIDQFYGDLYLEITDADTIIIKGNMDGGNTNIKIIDKYSFSFLERVDHPVFNYSPQTDLVTEKTTGGKIIIFRRVKKEEDADIVGNVESFNTFFIGQFFTDDYFKQKAKPEIADIWSGFLTYTPFTFDAVAIKNKQGKEEWYAWKFKGDTLELYNTTSTEDNESGFSIYKIGALKERYIKNK